MRVVTPLVRRMRLTRRLVPLAIVAACAGPSPTLEAPNVAPIGPRLVTSGQPTRAALQTLGAQGFQAVVYLAPWTVPDAIPDEPRILARQGIEFHHIPIPFGRPEAAHVQAVSAVLDRLDDKKVLVHCQLNLRASSMVFLHRVVTERQDAAEAYAAVAAVWSPQGPWWDLITTQLKAHGIAFEPY